MKREDYNKLVDKYNILACECGEEDSQELHLCECDNIPTVKTTNDGYYVECENCKHTTNIVFNEMDSGAREIVMDYWNKGLSYIP